MLFTPGQVSDGHSASPLERLSDRGGAELAMKVRNLGETAIPFQDLSLQAAQRQRFPPPLHPTE